MPEAAGETVRDICGFTSCSVGGGTSSPLTSICEKVCLEQLVVVGDWFSVRVEVGDLAPVN